MIPMEDISRKVVKIAIIYLIRLWGAPKYVGYTTRNLERRWKCHCYEAQSSKGGFVLHKAIRKYSKDAFTIEELYQSADLDHTLKMKENQFIMEHKTHVTEGGYNLTMGGEGSNGYIKSEKTCRKISEANKGKVPSDEARRNMSLAQKGRVHSKESRLKQSSALIGNKRSLGIIRTAETRLKLSNSHKGKTLSENHRQKLSDAHKGKILSEEHKRKISEAGKKRWDLCSRMK